MNDLTADAAAGAVAQCSIISINVCVSIVIVSTVKLKLQNKQLQVGV